MDSSTMFALQHNTTTNNTMVQFKIQNSDGTAFVNRIP